MRCCAKRQVLQAYTNIAVLITAICVDILITAVDLGNCIDVLIIAIDLGRHSSGCVLVVTLPLSPLSNLVQGGSLRFTFWEFHPAKFILIDDDGPTD